MKPDQVIFEIKISVKANGTLDCWTSPNHAASFDDVYKALVIARNECDRQLLVGPVKCPFRNHKGASS